MASQEQKVTVIGIHLGGAGTQKTAAVRATVTLRRLLSGIPFGNEHSILAKALAAYFPTLEIEPKVEGQKIEGGSTPLFWEAFSAEIGPAFRKDSDTRLLETVADLGGANVFCIDAALTLPPCLNCPESCSGMLPCNSTSTQLMRKIWEDRKNVDKRLRPPHPYMDRYFEVYARSTFDHPGFSGSFEVEAALGSNRAPLTARAISIARGLKHQYPKALIIETNSIISALGWALNSGYKIASLLELKSTESGSSARAGLLKKIEQKRVAVRSANLHEDLFMEFASQPEVFFAAMGALSAWGLLNGEILVTKEFLTLEKTSPLKGWACVPKDVANYAWNLRS